MTEHKLDAALRASLDDHHLSRSEKRALKAILEDIDPSSEAVAAIRGRAFDLARSALSTDEDRRVLAWLERVVKVLYQAAKPDAGPSSVGAWFAPHDDCPSAITSLFDRARRKVDVCVFTITDDRVSQSILDAHRRGVTIRIISDNDKAWDRGNDVQRLAEQGLAVRIDDSPAHMHNKFAIFDDTTLLTGSYNWTRSAANENQENLIVTDDRRLIEEFRGEFKRLWKRFER